MGSLLRGKSRDQVLRAISAAQGRELAVAREERANEDQQFARNREARAAAFDAARGVQAAERAALDQRKFGEQQLHNAAMEEAAIGNQNIARDSLKLREQESVLTMRDKQLAIKEQAARLRATERIQIQTDEFLTDVLNEDPDPSSPNFGYWKAQKLAKYKDLLGSDGAPAHPNAKAWWEDATKKEAFWAEENAKIRAEQRKPAELGTTAVTEKYNPEDKTTTTSTTTTLPIQPGQVVAPAVPPPSTADDWLKKKLGK